MKKLVLFFLCFIIPVILISCGKKIEEKDIELMGAGDRIHDSFTFANLGVEIKETEEDVYQISGSVEKIENDNIKNEFKIDSEINNVVVIKLSANGEDVDKEKYYVKVDGVRFFDAEHMNGSDYTFVILEAVKGKTVSVIVSWNGVDENSYVLKFDEDLILK